jgi:hypothetical protein
MTKADYSEVDAMRDVDAALAKVDADAQQRVIAWAISKHRLSPETSPGERTGLSHAPSSLPPKDIKSFLIQKRPAGYYERIACLVYHLEKFQNASEVGTKEIIQANGDARQSKMSNASVFIKHTIHTYGYLNSLGGRRFALSARGEALVDALPDRAGVEAALAANPFGKRPSRKKRNNKK